MARPIRVFFSYSHKDEALRDALETHLAVLKREGVIQSWHDRRIDPGVEWADQIDRALDSTWALLSRRADGTALFRRTRGLSHTSWEGQIMPETSPEHENPYKTRASERNKKFPSRA